METGFHTLYNLDIQPFKGGSFFYFAIIWKNCNVVNKMPAYTG